MTNFEQSLKDQADQFSMLPSKRVWHGIYNDLHPGSKWPSIAVGFVFLFTLLGIGHLNNTGKQHNAMIPSSETNGPEITENEKAPVHTIDKKHSSGVAALLSQTNSSETPNSFFEENKNNGAVPGLTGKIIPLYPEATGLTKNIDDQETLTAKSYNFYPPVGDKINIGASTNNFDQVATSGQAESLTEVPVVKNEVPFTVSAEFADSLKSGAAQLILEPVPLDKTTEDNETIENNRANETSAAAIHLLKKRNERIQWLYFVTPAVSTATFDGKPYPPPANSNLSPVIPGPNQNKYGMLYKARLGYQIGTEMQFAFTKEWRLTAGGHLSYSGYNVISNQVHPTFATLMLMDNNSGSPHVRSYITHYGNGEGQNQISLSNYSYQFSIPLGLQYAIFENGKFMINLSSSVEPSLILKSNAYIISSDGRYYVNDPDLLRKINVSGNFGSFITFKSDKIKWQLGPNIRYQLLSTYQKIYPVKEHLIDYGIRIGISR